jgi:hypothetical protein
MRIEQDRPQGFEKLLEFKVLTKTMGEIFEYFCIKFSNLNTECLLLLDTKAEPIYYFCRYLSNKKRSELLDDYKKVNESFDKEPSQEIMGIFDGNYDFSKKKKSEAKQKKKGDLEFSNIVVANLKLIKKHIDYETVALECVKLFQ